VATTLEYLSQVLDPDTGQTLYTFTKAREIDLSFTRPSATYVVPGVSGGYDPRGTLPNPIAPRTLPFKFWHTYAPNETYTQARDALMRAIGNKRVLLYLAMPDGSFRRNYGKLTKFPQVLNKDATLSALEISMEFALENAYWKSLLPAGVIAYDLGYHYDFGFRYDNINVLALNAGSQQISVTNSGDAPDYEAVFTVVGPYTAPFAVQNLTIPIGGVYSEVFTYNRSLNAGDVLTVDTGIGAVTYNGVPDWGSFSWGQAGYGQREWMRVEPGVNTFQVGHASGSTGGFFVVSSYDTFL
jgi:hypothetical protein